MPWWAQFVVSILAILFGGAGGYGGAKYHSMQKKKVDDNVAKSDFEELKNKVQHIEKKLSKIDGKLDIVVELVTKNKE